VSKRQPLPTADELVALIEQFGTVVAVAQHLGVPDQTLHSAVRRMVLEGDTTIKDRLRDAKLKSKARPESFKGSIDWPSIDVLKKMVIEAPSMRSVSQALGVSDGGLRNHLERHGVDAKALRSGNHTKLDGTTATLTASELKDAEELCLERGFSMDDWRIDRARVNEWTGAGGEMHKQLRVDLVRKPDLKMIFPASDVPRRKAPKVRPASQSRPQLWVLVSDHQAPLHSEEAHTAFLGFCERVKPDCGVHLGDLVDFSNISRFGDSGDQRFNASAQDCINTGYRILSEIVEASSNTKWWFMLGNHDERIRNESLLRAERLWGIRPADIPGSSREDDALSIRRLLRLDELGITCIDEPGGYKHNRLRIGEDFEIRHGMFTGGQPAKKTMDSLQASVAVGHTHAKSHAFKALFDREGISTIVQGAEIGHMAQNNLGYNHGRSDWHPGWATVTLFPDGTTNIEHCVFDEKRGKATWRGQQF
jgi:lambda repressor-like predicted transcriptional regulator